MWSTRVELDLAISSGHVIKAVFLESVLRECFPCISMHVGYRLVARTRVYLHAQPQARESRNKLVRPHKVERCLFRMIIFSPSGSSP